jgi:hypothetical protein
MGGRCYAVSANADGRGFSSIDMKGLQASYNSNKGLLITVPIFLYDPDKGSVPAGHLNVRISRKNVSLRRGPPCLLRSFDEDIGV